jgi:predicted nucleic acid-binding protein
MLSGGFEMTDRPDVRLYWDANCFLSYINGIPDRLPDLDALLAEASRGEVEILTSTISMVEVAFGQAEQDNKQLDPGVEAALNELWTPSSPIELVEFYPQIAQRAKDLMRSGLPMGWQLKPMDAIHLATAQHFEATYIHTYDDKLDRYAADIGIPIVRPTAVRPLLPWPVEQLPARASNTEDANALPQGPNGQ